MIPCTCYRMWVITPYTYANSVLSWPFQYSGPPCLHQPYYFFDMVTKMINVDTNYAHPLGLNFILGIALSLVKQSVLSLSSLSSLLLSWTRKSPYLEVNVPERASYNARNLSNLAKNCLHRIDWHGLKVS